MSDLEDIKKLSPEDRIKKLKKLEEDRKKEIEEAEKLLKASQSELEKKRKKQQNELIEQVIQGERRKIEQERRLDEMLEGLQLDAKKREDPIEHVVATYEGVKALDYKTLSPDEKVNLSEIYQTISAMYTEDEHMRDVTYATKKVISNMLGDKDRTDYFM